MESLNLYCGVLVNDNSLTPSILNPLCKVSVLTHF